MIRESKQTLIDYCSDGELDYVKYRTRFIDDDGLMFDDAYRLAHLPLVAPDHPRVIQTKSGSGYYRGIHDLIYSIAIPMPIDALLTSETFNTLYAEIQSAKFAHKISWDTFSQRKNKLHATLCGSLSIGKAPDFDSHIYHDLSSIGPVSIRVRGLFSGNLNIGRLYLKVYPERRNGKNMCHEIQQLFEKSTTDLYLVGIFNFIDELDRSEAKALEALLDRWWDIELVHLKMVTLWLIQSRDDLVLDGGIDQVIPLV